MKTKLSTFATRLRATRAKAGLTQARLAREAGLTVTAVAMLERGERRPLAATVAKLAAALGATANDLIGN